MATMQVSYGFNQIRHSYKTEIKMWDFFARVFEFLTELLRRTSTRNNVMNIIALLTEMKFLLDNTRAQRILILKLENGGGVIKPGVQLYASILYEEYEKRENFRAIKERFQRTGLDSASLNMLAQAIEKKSVTIDMREIKPEGLIYSLYRVEGIEYAEVYHLIDSRKAVFFLSVSTTDEEEKFETNGDHSQILLSVSKMKNLLSGRVKTRAVKHD